MDLEPFDGDFLDIPVVDLFEEFGVRNPILGGLAHLEHLERDQEHEDENHPENHRPQGFAGLADARALRHAGALSLIVFSICHI
jgi:hypothetical protein